MKQNEREGQMTLPEDYHYYKVLADSQTGKRLLAMLHACKKCEQAADDWCKKFGAKYYCDDPNYFAGGVACVAFDAEPDPKLWREYTTVDGEQYYLPACEAVADKVEIPNRDYALRDTWDTMYLRDQIREVKETAEDGATVKRLYVARLTFRPAGEQLDSLGRVIQAGRKLRRAIGAEQKRLRLPVVSVQQVYQAFGAVVPDGRLVPRTPIVFLYGASLYLGSAYPCEAKGLTEITMQQCRTAACKFEREDGQGN